MGNFHRFKLLEGIPFARLSRLKIDHTTARGSTADRLSLGGNNNNNSRAIFDSLSRRITSDLSDSLRIQASMPVKDGVLSLDIKRVSSLALPAFMASAASTLSVQVDILADCEKSENDFLQSYL